MTSDRNPIRVHIDFAPSSDPHEVQAAIQDAVRDRWIKHIEHMQRRLDAEPARMRRFYRRKAAADKVRRFLGWTQPDDGGPS